ncbi:hypothetical protein BU202_06860 [Streptococcus cuniculi]|uniref:DUF4300 domain-containing protein n=1 Tax=Streptococcus cuniculi TaxID=1432788 RepID=A0A1Q8E7J0_9STRE|nr:DUF4300 family protein [Streptococcus cuniculi]OLF47743.1 hypothetical protein BU202_06860 [Streptococcus cuniculi]
MRLKFKPLVALCAVFLVGCQATSKTETKQETTPRYRYHNVVTEKSAADFQKDLQELGVPNENWQALSPFIDSYHQANQSYEKVAKDWTTMKIGQDANTFTTTMEEAEYKEKLSHFPKDLNCRQTAFLLLRSLLTYDTDKVKSLPEHLEFQALKKEDASFTEAESQLYSLLFNDNPSYKSVADLTKAWKEAGLRFSDKLRLLSAVQNVEGAVVSMHVGLAYEKDGKVYFFEKMDPALPYRLSEFQSWKELQEHLLNGRFQMFKEQITLLANDQNVSELAKAK